MKFEIEIKLGVTDAFEQMLNRVLGQVAYRETEAAKTFELAEPAKSDRSDGSDKSDKSDRSDKSDGSDRSEEAVKPAGSVYASDDDLKTLMDVTISRFCGEDWRETKDAETQGLIRQCTRVFKEIARHLGADKPLQLPGEKRAEFITQLDKVEKWNDANAGRFVIEWKPF